jgi:hypothetical protein
MAIGDIVSRDLVSVDDKLGSTHSGNKGNDPQA